MRYDVTASADVENKLAEIWLRSRRRDAVRRASDRIDWLLKHYPLDQGHEYRTGRIMTVEPLTVRYIVSPDDRRVEIIDYAYNDTNGR